MRMGSRCTREQRQGLLRGGERVLHIMQVHNASRYCPFKSCKGQGTGARVWAAAAARSDAHCEVGRGCLDASHIMQAAADHSRPGGMHVDGCCIADMVHASGVHQACIRHPCTPHTAMHGPTTSPATFTSPLPRPAPPRRLATMQCRSCPPTSSASFSQPSLPLSLNLLPHWITLFPSTSLHAVSQLSTRLISFLLNLVIARHLSPEAYGVRGAQW